MILFARPPPAAGQGEACATENGDVNADGEVDMSDAINILHHQFLGGPPALPICQTPVPSGLPDTGQTTCYDRNREIPCDGATCPGQDGIYATGCPSEGRFAIDNQLGKVTDFCTGLMWQWDTADVNGDGRIDGQDSLPWCDALAYCENLSFAGHDDWRLPNVRELQSIVNYGHGRDNPAIDPVFGALSSDYWSSTSGSVTPGYAWLVDFYYGRVDGGLKDAHHYVQAVRGGL
ncbi:MAG: DUF1566 domain-containing protein [Planctomycetes bacterium]|nr:DUF1566 domain-containing protein [Planctomycetota bacterium]